MHRKIRTFGPVSLVLMLSLVAPGALASDRSMRCGGHLIVAGGGQDSASMYEVLKKCGKPVERQGDTWIYSQDNVRRHLTFNYESRLLRIETFRS